MSDEIPHVIAVAGPNGSGKTSRAPKVLRELFGLTDYVNADVIAQGLSAFRPETVAFDAGRVMLRRLHKLSAARQSFAFETTFAGRAHARWIERNKTESGYEFHIMYLWLRSPELAVQRVRQRVRQGGHDIPDEVVRRRYASGVRNFFGLYRPLANSWGLYDNSVYNNPHMVAIGGENMETRVFDEQVWRQFCEAAK
ncbi:MAG TPA: AAA family ATPase [Pyrinomonadaceae bacterium]|jgi:predicted ABC-type ATPase|nr:AAA family ATPase [Pyrinomonadaceae bacterium]